MHTEFEVYALNEAGITNSRYIAAHFDKLLDCLDAICPKSREYSIVKTKLEEASFFAKKAMASAKENQLIVPPSSQP